MFKQPKKPKKPKYYFCQSCGLPYSKKKMVVSQNKAGFDVLLYCKECFKDGAFTHPEFTLKDMEIHVVYKLLKLGFDKEVCRNYVDGISELKRWKPDEDEDDEENVDDKATLN